jgi:amino acid adenylation domain-containing protein
MNDIATHETLSLVANAAAEGDLYPLSTAQLGVLLEQLIQPERPCYNIGGASALDGVIDLKAWEGAIARVVQSNDALRLVLQREERGVALQRLLPELPFTLVQHDFSNRVDAEQHAWAHVREAFSRPFELWGQPLWEVQWVQFSPTRALFLMRFHHLIADGASIVVFGQQLVQAYNQLVRGGQAPVDPAPSYLEFVSDEQAYLGSERHQRDRAYWMQQMAHGVQPLLSLPQQEPGQRMAQHQLWEIERQQYQALQAAAQRMGGTITQLLLAVVAVYFARIAGQREQAVLGLAMHNRSSARRWQTLGMFSQVLPVVVSTRSHITFEASMHELLVQMRASYRHVRYPQIELLREMHHGQSERQRLYDIMVSVEPFEGEVDVAGARAHTVRLPNGYEPVPLSLTVCDYEKSHTVQVQFSHDPQVLSAPQAQATIRRLHHLLDAVIAAPETAIGKLPLMAPDEAEQLAGFNGTEQSYPGGCIHQLFEAQVARTPSAVALEYEGQQLSYAQLEARANQLARHLKKLGVEADQRVAIALPRSLELVVALLGTLKAGGAYVPLDPAYPAERLQYMLQDSQPVVVLSTESVAQSLPLQGQPLCCLDEAQPLWAQEPETALGEPVRANDAAYVIYTSGSTGRPKGVCMPHAVLVNLVCWQICSQPGAKRTLQYAALGFDVSFQEVFTTLCAGGQLILIDEASRLDPRLLSAHIRDQRVERLFLPYVALKALATHCHADSGCELDFGSLTEVITAGEQLVLTPEIESLFSHRLAHARLHNHYGPTETHVASAYALPAEVSRWHRLPPIGRPIANTRFYIVDACLQPVPIGVSGEIYIGGAAVAHGYLHRPGLTAERFVPDPFAMEPGARMYQTGDLGRWLPDGTMEYLGRNDHQIKVRGFRIEPGEIETRLRAHPQVRDAVVSMREDEPGQARLVAYLIADSVLTPETLRLHVAQELPEYMVPAAYVWLHQLPLTPNGKLDRQALPEPQTSAYGVAPYEAPQGEIEQALAQIWSHLLGVPQVGRHDDFFALGGHSLLAVRVVSNVQQGLRLALPLREIFARRTVRELAEYLEELAPTSVLPAMERVPRDTLLPLAPVQERLWVVHQMPGLQASYNMPMALQLQGPLSMPALQSAFDLLLQRHETLRTRFVADADGSPRQVIEPTLGLHVPVRPARQEEVSALAQAHAQQVFDLGRAPLLSVQVLEIDEQEHVPGARDAAAVCRSAAGRDRAAA